MAEDNLDQELPEEVPGETPADVPGEMPDETSSPPETEPVPPVPPAAEVIPVDTQSDEHKRKDRTISVLAAALIIVALCFCGAMAISSGFSLGGGSEPATPTPGPDLLPTQTPTPLPTPVPGDPPVAVISGPSQAVVGQEITFDGSNSTSSNAIASYDWDFGDGTVATGESVRHTYTAPGTYKVTLLVTDREGLTDSASYQVKVVEPEPTAEAPNAVIQAPSEAQVGERVTFNGSESTSGNPIVSYTWDFGDGGQGNGAVVDYIYQSPGNFTVSLTIADSSGATAATTTQIAINETPQTGPSAVITGPSQATIGERVDFSAADSQTGSSAIVNYGWDFGNGKSTQGSREVNVSTTYDAPGQYQVTLEVTDENGLADTATSNIQVNATLEGIDWSLKSVLPGTTITALFNNGNLTGFGGCNDYNGSYETPDASQPTGSITVGEITVTQKACQEEALAQEARYLDALSAVTTYEVSGSSLALRFPGGNLGYSVEPVATQ